jgi:preprotein translocase subunit SecY
VQSEPTKSKAPFKPDEYPGLISDFRRILNIGAFLAGLLVVLPGYVVLFLKIQVGDLWSSSELLSHCSLCKTRYEDLQAYDEISGSVYVTVMPLFFVVSVLIYVTLLASYIRARSLTKMHKPMLKGVHRSVVLFTMVLVVMLFVIVFLPTDLNDNRYPGAMQLLAASTYPVLAGFASLIVSLVMFQLSVFALKTFKF